MLAACSSSLAYALVVAFSLPIAIIITPVGGFLFGVWLGALLSVIGATLGSVAVFLAARTAFYDLFHARAGAALARLEDGFRRDSFSYLLFLRLVPVFPVLAGQYRAGAARHEARPLHAGDADRHHSRRRSSMPSVGAGFGMLFDRGEVPDLGIIFEWRILLPLLGLAVLALVPVLYTHLRARQDVVVR